MDKKYVLFGAGATGEKVVDVIGKEKIAFYIDNSAKKQGTCLNGIPVESYVGKRDVLSNYQIVVTVGSEYEKEIVNQLKKDGFNEFIYARSILIPVVRERMKARVDYIKGYKSAVSWILANTVEGEGIICNTGLRRSYPEVTGYYIPTLIKWGYKDLAIQYAKYLVSIQKEDGSWYDTENAAPYVFDSAQILKGLLAVRDLYPAVDASIQKGCEWIISNVQESGRLTTPDTSCWGEGRACSELIHLYCLSPLIEAGKRYQKDSYIEIAQKVLAYYKTNHYEKIMNFTFLSHFYAYVMEALLDLGEDAMVREAMAKVACLQEENGMVPAYCDVHWVCSTGLFQFALVWFRLGGEWREAGEKAFEYACKLQNPSGGWYGSYPTDQSLTENNDYFPNSEISWAVKYYLDALYYKNVAEFDAQSGHFLESIDKQDERYAAIRKLCHGEAPIKVLDAGCGKGRYLKNLLEDEPENLYYGMDLSSRVLESITDPRVITKTGSLCNIPYEDNFFDVIYTCEALEHAIDIQSAVKEMARVTKPGGHVVIVDKNAQQLGILEIGQWEQWFEEEELKAILSSYCTTVKTGSLAYENSTDNGLFLLWDGIVKEEKQL